MPIDSPCFVGHFTMATLTRLFVNHRYEVNLFFIVAAVAVSAASSLPQAPAEGLVERRRQNCKGDPSILANECLEPLQNEEDLEEGVDALGVQTPEELDEVCGDLLRARSCVADVYLHCGRANMETHINVQTLFGVVDYLCSRQGRRLLFSESACWEKEEVDAIFDNCSAEENFGSGNICSDLPGVRKCIKKGVRKACNKRAAKFADKLFYYSLEPLARNLFNCDLALRIPRSLLKAVARKRQVD